MNKNLKKVISSVAALTMVASSVAAFAVDFPDVESTASYAQAVQELSALDVISGYDDGTFGPDKLVTRAEITKMIVDALAERSSAEASTESTKFADVSADHWAKGYINQGVADGFIAGMSDTEFDPDANVTYVQAQKMLVSAIGYETYAAAQGGWPTGYKTYAASLDITKGISGITDNTELTRAQVAQMIDNAMDAPLCVIASWKTEWNGTRTPNLETRDGKEGRAYETLFTEKHDAYKVYGRVTKTSKTDDLNADKVAFKVEKADNFDDEEITTDNMQEPDMYIGNSGADNYLLTYAQALIQKNDDDEYTILSIAPAAANKTVTLASEDYDSTKSADAASALYFYPAGTTKGSVKYALDKEGFEVYVNGVKDDNYSSNIGNLKTYLASTETASVTLQKKTKDGSTSTSSDYNIVMISTYATAIVESVTDKSNQTTIYFDDQSTGVSTKLVVDKEDDKKSYSFILDGAAIEPTELQEDDVLSIAYDKSNNRSFSDSSFYDVYVTRNVVEGVKCTSIKKDSENPDNTEYTMGGTKYKAAEGMPIKAEISTEYTLNLDHFGRIARIDETASSKNYGILKNIYKKAGGDYMAQIITKTGAEEEYKIDSKNVANYKAILGTNLGDNGIDYNTLTDKQLKEAYVNHVVDYSVSSSSNKVTIKDAKALAKDKVVEKKEYKADGNKIGTLKLSDSTVILSVEDTKAKDTVSVVSNLTDGTNYTAYAFGKSSADSTYRFVIITDGLTGFDSTTQLAVYNGSETVEEDGENVTAFNVIIDGEEKQFIVDDEPDFNGVDEDKFEEGDPIVFVTNAEGKIQKLYSLFTQGSLNKKSGNFSSFLTDVLDNKVAVSNLTTIAGNLTDNNDTVDLYFGPVVNKSGSNITIGAVEEISGYDADGNPKTFTHAVDYDGANAHEINYKDAKIYTYDFAASSRNSRVLLDEGIASTPDSRAAKLRDKDGDIVDVIDLDSSEIKDDIVYALVRSIDDNAQEIYLIVNNNN